jgi:two-component system, NarL family, response regulator DevR
MEVIHLKQEDNIKIRVVIIDDDANWIRFLTVNISSNEEDMMIVGSATTVEKAVELVRTLEPDIVLLDINLTENRYDGIDVAYEITKTSKTKIIMLSHFFSEDLVRESFTAGAVNYLSKSDTHRIPDTIRTIYKGASVIEILARDYGRLKVSERKEKILNILSDAEKEIMNLYIMGYKRKDIASSLGKTEDTIKNQVSSSYKKLKIGNRKELLAKLQFYFSSGLKF